MFIYHYAENILHTKKEENNMTAFAIVFILVVVVVDKMEVKTERA